MKNILGLIPIEQRISMLQTTLNVAGSNFQGKRTTSKNILKVSFELYEGMMKQIEATQGGRIVKVKPDIVTKKPMPKKNAQALLKKVSKKNRGKKWLVKK